MNNQFTESQLTEMNQKIDWEGQFQTLFNEAKVIIVDKYVIEPPIEEVWRVLASFTR